MRSGRCAGRLPSCAGPMRSATPRRRSSRGGARPPNSVIISYIDDHRQEFGVEPICAVLTQHGVPIAPNTYRAHKRVPISPAELDEAYAVNAVIDLWRRNNELYGIRKMWHAMRRAGHRIGRDQVGRLMRIAGVQGV